jgi:asparagine synthase (glutamine-hydrolysing)
LQDTFKNLVPKEVVYRPNKRFETPIKSLLQGEARPLVEQYLSDDLIRRQRIFDPGQVQRLRVSMAGSAGGQWHTQVWNLVVFQHWWQRWMA